MEKISKKQVQITLLERCNLNCVYCYEHSKSVKVMDLSLMKKIIEEEFVQAERENIEMLNIYFHGGEICLEFRLLKEICEWIWSKQWNIQYHCSATTNGTLVHGDIQEWFRRNINRFTLGLSLDGNRLMHNLNRCNSYDNIDLDFFLEAYPHKEVKMTISPLTVHGLADGIIDIINKGFRLSANLAYDCNWNDESLKRQYAKELFDLSLFFLQNPKKIPPLKLFDKDFVNLGLQVYLKKGFSAQRTCGTGLNMCCYGMDGTKYPCQMFLPSSTGDSVFESCKITDEALSYSEECKVCTIFAICPNCIGSNYASYQDLVQRPNDMCDYKMIEILNYSYFLSKVIEEKGKFGYYTYDSVKDSLNILAIDFIQRNLRNSSIRKYVERLNY